MSNGKAMIVHLIAGLIKKTMNAIISYKNELIFSYTISTIWWRYKC